MSNRNPVNNLPKGKKSRGRPKGSKDKIPQELKAKVLFVCEQLERENQGLDVLAKKDPAWFYQNFLKVMLPRDVQLGGKDGEPLALKIVLNRESVTDKPVKK